MRASSIISLVTLSCLVGACAPKSTCPQGVCGTVVMGTTADADVLFPPFAGTNVSSAIDDQLFLPLAEMGLGLNTVGDSGFVPRLADRWSFEDSVTIVFHIDSRARWQDGVPVTARDVAFTYDVYTDTLVNALARPLLSGIASVTVRDSLDAVFRFTHPYPEQFYDATHQMKILPRHLLDTVPRDRFADAAFGHHPVGDGPYRFVSWTPGQAIELQADTTFFLGRPGVARLIWREAADLNTLLSQLAAGEIDMIDVLLGPDNVARAAAVPGVRLIPYATNVYTYIGFNLRDPEHPSAPHPLFANRAMRQAIGYGIDRAEIIRTVLGGLGEIPTGPTTPLVSIWNDSLRQLPYDTARADHLLDSLGWRPGPDGIRRRAGHILSFRLISPTSSTARQRASVIIQDQLKHIGVRMDLRPLELNTFSDRAQHGRFDAVFGGWTIDPVPSAMRQFWTTEAIGGFNWGSYHDPVFDSLLARATAARSPTVARQLWDQTIERINTEAPAIWIYTPSLVAAVSKRLENVTIRPDEWAVNLWQWHVDPTRALARDRLGAP